MMYGNPGGYGPMAGGWGELLFLGFGLIFLVGLVLLVIWIVRSMNAPGRGPGEKPGDDACAIARTRYARGEITKEQYEEMCRVLAS